MVDLQLVLEKIENIKESNLEAHSEIKTLIKEKDTRDRENFNNLYEKTRSIEVNIASKIHPCQEAAENKKCTPSKAVPGLLVTVKQHARLLGFIGTTSFGTLIALVIYFVKKG